MMKNIKLILIFTIILISFVNANVLVNTTIDKSELTLNEVGFLTIKLDNDTNKKLENYVLRIEATQNITFLKSNTNILLENIEQLLPDLKKEIKIKFKINSLQGDQGKIFVYYGNHGQFVSGTYVDLVNKQIGISTSKTIKTDKEGEKTLITIEINNYSNAPIHNIAIEAIVPERFNLLTPPTFIKTLKHNDSIKREFEILPPLGIAGEEEIILSYGYFDDMGPHYFEENFKMDYTKANNSMLTLIGVIVLVGAIILYMSKLTKPKDVKGTKEKAEEMPEEEKSKATPK